MPPSYLERELESLNDPYEVALVAWALTKADSGKKERAFSRLHMMRREHGKERSMEARRRRGGGQGQFIFPSIVGVIQEINCLLLEK